MKFVLYRYKETPMGKVLMYVKDIKDGKVSYSTRPKDAKRFSLTKAIFSSMKYGFTWIHEKYIKGNSQ